ncbi:unnamed protein product [Adineta ricciae]|uniref:Uncharacterized protein n=1 Tax=Adineta ricciae TaxID=249248 RepID=A0A815LJV6_ADIRI|nr:unnamed protein product [Adineta ricciae]
MMIILSWYIATQTSTNQCLRQEEKMLSIVHCCAADQRTSLKSLSSQQLIDIAYEKSLRWPHFTFVSNNFVRLSRN